MGVPIDLVATGIDRLLDRLRLAVIYNGEHTAPGAVIRSTFNPRSEKSYKPVAEDIAWALGELGFRQVELLPDDMRLGDRLRELRIDFAWLNTAGVQGYDAMAHAPALLELAGIPYFGHRPLLSVTLDNKHIFKRECAGLGLPTPPFLVFDGIRGPIESGNDGRLRAVFGDYAGPFVVKPVSGRASQHVTIASDLTELDRLVTEVYSKTLNFVQIEPFLSGSEYCVSVCGPIVARGGKLRRTDAPFAFSPLERLLEPGEAIFTSIDVRPITWDRVRLLGPNDGPIHGELVRLARAVWDEFQLRALVRLDIRADVHGRLQILEANPKPDLTRPSGDKLSLVCAGLAQHGMTYEDLILSLLVDRLDHYLRNRPAVVAHIAELLG
jgi:D-alanine-D-alanine ligase